MRSSVFLGDVSVTDGVSTSAARVRFVIGNTIDFIENWQIKQKGNIDQNCQSIDVCIPTAAASSCSDRSTRQQRQPTNVNRYDPLQRQQTIVNRCDQRK